MSDGHSLADRWWREPHTEHVQRPLEPIVCKKHGPFMPRHIADGDCPHCWHEMCDTDTPYHFPLKD